MNKVYLSIIGILFVVILLQIQCGPTDVITKETVKIDTVYKNVNRIETKTLTVYKTVTKRLAGDTVFVPDTNYNKLKEQYILLSKSYASRNLYIDTVKIDSIGILVVNDTIQYNAIRKRTYKHDYKIPTITKTIIKKADPTRQLYLGMQLSVEPKPLNYANAQFGLLYKDKKDRMFGVHAGLSQSQIPYVGLSTYILLNHKK
jgi:hypothetical protein